MFRYISILVVAAGAVFVGIAGASAVMGGIGRLLNVL